MDGVHDGIKVVRFNIGFADFIWFMRNVSTWNGHWNEQFADDFFFHHGKMPSNHMQTYIRYIFSFFSLYSCSKRNTKNDHKESSVTRARLTIKFKMSPCLIVFVLVRKYLKFVFWSVFEYLHRKKIIYFNTVGDRCTTM